MFFRRLVFAPAWMLACWLASSTVSAFPGVLVDQDGSKRLVHTTHVVILHGEAVSVVTVMIDYEGPRTPFALLLPVPPDVSIGQIHTLRREIVSRVEQVSAPRLHEFYEKDPCEPGPAEQSWEERLPAKSRGFLTPLTLPPPDASYRVSNEMSVPNQPVFKGEESEFSHTLISAPSRRRLEADLARRGYRLSDAAATRLLPHMSSGSKLLLSEVKLDRVELVGNATMQLGGIRYTTRTGVPPILATLGTLHAAGVQDLFVYVLDARSRYQAANYPNVFSPTNVAVLVEPRLDLGQAYNALFDRVVGERNAFVTEYAWPTEGCGEPCPNAPLQLRELLSLGGDEVEGQRAKRASPAPVASTESRDPDERALLERRAMIDRQRYLLSRLHYRYRPAALPNDVELTAAGAHIAGGSGVPAGPAAELSEAATPAPNSQFQTRFFASHAWTGTTPCNKPRRWRWGKRWKSMGRVSRTVPLALDLPRLARDPAALKNALVRPVAGFTPGQPPPPPSPRSVPTSARSAPTRSGGCAMAPLPPSPRAWLLLLGAALSSVRRRRVSSA